MSSIGNENGIDASHLAPLVKKEHVVHTCRTYGHHSAKPEAAQCSRSQQSGEVRRDCRTNPSQDCKEDR